MTKKEILNHIKDLEKYQRKLEQKLGRLYKKYVATTGADHITNLFSRCDALIPRRCVFSALRTNKFYLGVRKFYEERGFLTPKEIAALTKLIKDAETTEKNLHKNAKKRGDVRLDYGSFNPSLIGAPGNRITSDDRYWAQERERRKLTNERLDKEREARDNDYREQIRLGFLDPEDA